MLWKCLKNGSSLLRRKVTPTNVVLKRKAGEMFPPTQYDTPYPWRLKPMSAIKEYYEITPLIIFSCFPFVLAACAIAYALKHKMEYSFSRKHEDTIAGSMDLRHPTIHKVITINQEYKPWPEMQDVIDRMKEAERKMLLRGTSCYA